MFITILATIGAILSVSSNIPQVYKVWSSPNKKTTEDISVLSTCIHILAASSWSLYGFYLKLWILGTESFIVLLCWLLILIAIIKDNCYIKNEENITINNKN